MRTCEELVGAAKQGDRAALEELVLRHMPALRAYVRLRAGPVLRARESASDLVQSTCREVCESIATVEFRDDAAFRGWLFTLAWNKIASRRRHQLAARRDAEREAASLDLTPELAEELYAATLSPSGKASLREEAARLEAAFDLLPEDYREILALARFAELPHAEIAARLGRSEDACRCLLKRAIARLTTELRRLPGAKPGSGIE